MASTFIKLEWSNSCDLGEVYYQGGYENEVYLDADIGKPEYTVEEEGNENGDGVFVATTQKRIKNYRFEVYAPEYLVDALVDMALHDTIRLTLTNGLYSSTIRNVQVTPNWEEISEDCMALVEIKFQQDDQLIDTSCCANLSPDECEEAETSVIDQVCFDEIFDGLAMTMGDGGFDDSGSWSTGGKWILGVSEAGYNGAAVGTDTMTYTGTLTPSLIVGKYYRVTYTITTVFGVDPGEGMRVKLGSTNGTLCTANGTYTEILQCTTTASLSFQGVGSCLISIDSVSIGLIGSLNDQVLALDCPDATGAVYKWNGSTWVIKDFESAQSLTDPSNIFWKVLGADWVQYPSISELTEPTPNNINVKGYSLDDTWVRVYYSTDNISFTEVSGVITAIDFLNTGKTFAVVGSGTFYVKIKSENHNCNYGYSETQTISI